MFRYWFRNEDGDLEEFTDRVQEGWAANPGTDGLVMNAEEGSVGSCSLKVEDPDGDWDFPRGHREVLVLEDDDSVVYAGYTWVRTFERDLKRTGAARVIIMDHVDLNTLLERRIMVGSDCNRPAETDVARITWLLSTAEASFITDDLYFSTDGPVNMDAVDYRGQGFRQIFDDCSLQSGKNWFLWKNGTDTSIWYQPRGTTDFTSDLKISNVLTDIGEETFAPALTSQMKRDPSRVYSGIYRAYANSYVYTQNEPTAVAFARRDTFASSPNIKTKTKAITRSNRELSDISTEEDVITTSIMVPRVQTNAVVAGQRVQVRYTHFDGYEDYVWMRVLNRTVRELGVDQVELAMDLTPDEPVNVPSATVFGVIGKPQGFNAWPYVYFQYVGDWPIAGCGTHNTVGLIEALQDPDGPASPGWPFYGWKINGTGTINVTFYTSTIGIANPLTVIQQIRKNGISVAEVIYDASGFNGSQLTVSVDALDVEPDDVITAYVHSIPEDAPFFRTPRGTGDCLEALTITGGELV